LREIIKFKSSRPNYYKDDIIMEKSRQKACSTTKHTIKLKFFGVEGEYSRTKTTCGDESSKQKKVKKSRNKK